MSGWVHSCECRCLWNPEEGIGSPGAEVIGGCESPNIDACNKI